MGALAEDLRDRGRGKQERKTCRLFIHLKRKEKENRGEQRRENKERKKTPSYGVNLMRSQELHWAAQVGKRTFSVDFDLIT